MNKQLTQTESTFVPEAPPASTPSTQPSDTSPSDTQPTPPADTTPADTTPKVDSNNKEIRGNIPDHLKGVTLKETFLPEEADELPPGAAVAKTPEQIEEEKKKANEPTKPNDATQPSDQNKPAETTTQPKTTQNEEIIDKTKPKEDTLLAGKYKTVDELKKGIEELGGDHAGIDDPKLLEQVYKVSQATYTKLMQRQQKADEIAGKGNQEEPKGFQLTDEMVKGMVDQLDFNKIDDAKDMATQMFRIMFGTFQKSLPEMLPKQAPPMDPQAMAATVHNIEQATDALGYLEGKVPRLTSDTKFRNTFATFLSDGKKEGTYPKQATRESMIQAMKDFQTMLADMAGVSKPTEKETEDKNAAAIPDGGSTQSTETAVQEEDILGDIVGAKQARDAKIA